MQRKLEVVPYDLNWSNLFREEAWLVQKALGNNCTAVHHVGSTAVPGLPAKPVIDMLAVVKDIQAVDKAAEAMQQLGYEAKGEHGIAFRRFFLKGKELRTHHVHVFQIGDAEIERHVHFRDWLISHPEDAKNYAVLKQHLAQQFPNDINGYCNGKEAFISEIDAKSGYRGCRLVKALTEKEWQAVRDFRKRYFFKAFDPYTWTFEDNKHVHFVFYSNATIAGYAHLQLWPENRAVLRILVIERSLRKQGLGSLLIRQCERWLTHQGYASLHTQSRKESLPFYLKQNYQEMAFNDPDGYELDPDDISIGKIL